jgi:hypothetical protein
MDKRTNIQYLTVVKILRPNLKTAYTQYIFGIFGTESWKELFKYDWSTVAWQKQP